MVSPNVELLSVEIWAMVMPVGAICTIHGLRNSHASLLILY